MRVPLLQAIGEHRLILPLALLATACVATIVNIYATVTVNRVFASVRCETGLVLRPGAVCVVIMPPVLVSPAPAPALGKSL